eukprot:CAMPEP_0203745956 /NCGR_PEP_ID=MMETSP0098-20131031/1541_1 /ASSEMBLY_ACC=CAM_ASM_000208 /TAXON_ID=96639 /ORGANISM=" , Strain NY0313808BC1" /LENGTH=1280 /DNA_ID=CAMNT_0050633889 /DNA_START=230 /DNA_END=4069 /DNA_ORIENTATION=+
MDADILRKQIRKSLVSSRRFNQKELEDILNKEEDGEEEEVLVGSELSSPASMNGEIKKLGNRDESDSDNYFATQGSSDLQVDVEDTGDWDTGLLIPSGGDSFAEDEENSDSALDQNGAGLNHASVMDAWSKQIEQSLGQLKTYDNDHGEGSRVKVEYVKGGQTIPLDSPFGSISDDGIDFVPGATSREDLENLGKIYLRVKLEAFLWLERITGETIYDGHTTPDTATIFEMLKSGVILCQIANKLLPGCIASYTSDFSNDSSFMVPLSERENIKRFIRACEDSMNIPESLLFDVGDLHNMENMPKVVLSLRAIAEYARLHLGSPPELYWPTFQDLHTILEADEDAVLLASAEMSKMDIPTVHHMYASTIKKKTHVSTKSLDDLSTSGFMDRKRSIQQNLVLSVNPPIAPKTPIIDSGSVELRSLEEDQSICSSSKGGAAALFTPASSISDGQLETLSVKEWLDSLGMGSYYTNFVEEGWDEIDTVALMQEADLEDCGVHKRGHRRRIVNGLKRLKARLLERGILDGADDEGELTKSPSTELRTRRSSSTGESIKELMNKELAWAKCRASSNVTLDLEDAKAIWSMFNDLKGRFVRATHASVETSRSISHIFSMTEDIVRSLIPFDAPIIIDIGWNSIKCGYVFNHRPIRIPTVVGKLNLGALTSGGGGKTHLRRSSNVHSLTAGRHVLTQCHTSLASSSTGVTSGSSVINSAPFVVRRSIHRGIDSIKDPVIVEWDDIEQLLKHIYRDVLHTTPDKHPLLIVEPCNGWDNESRCKLADVLFNKLEVPAAYFTPGAPMVAHHTNLGNCTVLDLGESRSTASVVFNYRQVRGANVHSPIGGLQLTELMMKSLTQEGYDFKSIFEAKNPGKFSSLRHFMEQEVAEEIKKRVSSIAPNAEASSTIHEEMCIQADKLPAHVSEYLPRVTRGIDHINIADPRSSVPEALFSPGVIRRDQFYNGGSLHQIVKEAIKRCTDVVQNVSSSTVILCGGMAAIPGIAERLQVELNGLYSTDSRKPPRVVLASEEVAASEENMNSRQSTTPSSPNSQSSNSLDHATFAAWYGASKLALEKDFQARWISRESYLEKGDKTILESTVSEGLGPFPLHSPDTALYKANRAVTSLADVVGLIEHFESREQPQEGARSLPAVQTKLPVTPGSPPRGKSTPLSPQALKYVVQEVAQYLDNQGCPQKDVLDVKIYLWQQYASQPPRAQVSVIDVIQSLPESLRSIVAPYVAKKARKDEERKLPASTKTVDGVALTPGTLNSPSKFSEEDEDDDEGVWAM